MSVFLSIVLSYERGLYYPIAHWTIVAPIGKSDPAFDLQSDIIFGGIGGAKMNKFLGRNLKINTPHVTTCQKYILCFAPITARPILVDARSIALKARVTFRLVRPKISMSSAYASNWTLF